MTESELIEVKNLSHNINTPLTTILGYVSLIEKKSLDNDDVLTWIDNIKAEVLKISKYSKEINKIVSSKNYP